MPDSRDKRRWYQLSIREMFLILFAVAFFCGWLEIRLGIRRDLRKARADQDESIRILFEDIGDLHARIKWLEEKHGKTSELD